MVGSTKVIETERRRRETDLHPKSMVVFVVAVRYCLLLFAVGSISVASDKSEEPGFLVFYIPMQNDWMLLLLRLLLLE